MFPIKFYTQKRIFKYYTGLSFFIFIWISRLEKDEERLVRHEKIHFRQQIELLFVFHWLLYIYFYIVARLYGHHHYIAYRYNPFELEAYRHDPDQRYLITRKPYSWIRFIKEFNAILKKDMRAMIPVRKEANFDK
jgi:hypothetical protein